jgi:hypothetical protein
VRAKPHNRHPTNLQVETRRKLELRLLALTPMYSANAYKDHKEI